MWGHFLLVLDVFLEDMFYCKSRSPCALYRLVYLCDYTKYVFMYRHWYRSKLPWTVILNTTSKWHVNMLITIRKRSDKSQRDSKWWEKMWNLPIQNLQHPSLTRGPALMVVQRTRGRQEWARRGSHVIWLSGQKRIPWWFIVAKTYVPAHGYFVSF